MSVFINSLQFALDRRNWVETEQLCPSCPCCDFTKLNCVKFSFHPIELCHLLIALAGCEQWLECGSKANDVKTAARHQALENNHHGILRRKAWADLGPERWLSLLSDRVSQREVTGAAVSFHPAFPLLQHMGSLWRKTIYLHFHSSERHRDGSDYNNLQGNNCYGAFKRKSLHRDMFQF